MKTPVSASYSCVIMFAIDQSGFLLSSSLFLLFVWFRPAFATSARVEQVAGGKARQFGLDAIGELRMFRSRS
eukprot:m.293192 g.293192  ORF g.293192 m.293192 type:complete len:72 (-) comp55120_c0_seq2:27-242(-)